MAEKKFKGSPFGTQTARFDVSGVHPKVKVPGTFTEIPYDKKSIEELNRRMGPGSYHVDVGGFNRKTVDEKASGPGWARAHEVERSAALPHLLHKEQWEMKKELIRKLGPGSYEIKDFLENSDLKPRSARGICETRATRFKELLNEIPGPGTYGKGGIPHSACEEKAQLSTSTVGMLDAGSSTPRNLPSVGSKLGPGTYNFKSFAEQTVNKVTSVRGPYDLFSGDRNKPITVGYLAAPKLANLGPGQYQLKSFVDDWETIHRNRQGKFGKVKQYPEQPTDRVFCSTLSQCPKEETQPGPGQYEPKELVRPGSKKAPGFLSTAQRNDKLSQKFFTQNFNPVGPGRYDIQKYEEAQHRNGNSSVFQAKTGRLSLAMEKFLKERVRGKDVRVEDRVFLVEPQAPPGYDMYRSKTQENFTKLKAMTIA
ncbi:ciliary microtubule-associated protein 2-like [Ruditapes philippinarum]|uniref:ciliary microtubule-associated protein 2-like n=1 Tax=Ruditapes philippinarum TaxID=129788 RepID=UPI00295C25D6|nr:ciliary microtubule-associated protein 2-like [Ruditapes philippinarum]